MIYGVSDHYSVLTVCTFGVMLRFSINFNMNSSDTPSCSRHGLHSITLLMGKQGEGNKTYTEKEVLALYDSPTNVGKSVRRQNRG